jgi:hypothetical protein
MVFSSKKLDVNYDLYFPKKGMNNFLTAETQRHKEKPLRLSVLAVKYAKMI